MSINFPGFGGSRPDRNSYRARLAERAILGGATAKRPVRRPVSIKHPLRAADRSPISCIQTRGLSDRDVVPVRDRTLIDRISQTVMTWTLRCCAAVVAFILMTATPGWLEAAWAARQTPWGF